VHGGGFYEENLVNVLLFDDLQMGAAGRRPPFGSSEFKLAAYRDYHLAYGEPLRRASGVNVCYPMDIVKSA